MNFDRALLIALLTGMAHIVCGVCVLAEPGALSVTPLASFNWFVGFSPYPHLIAGWSLLIAGTAAVFAFMISQTRTTLPLVLLAPQQVLLCLMLLSIGYAVVEGYYPDLYHPKGGALFILPDQIWAWLYAVPHSLFVAKAVRERLRRE